MVLPWRKRLPSRCCEHSCIRAAGCLQSLLCCLPALNFACSQHPRCQATVVIAGVLHFVPVCFERAGYSAALTSGNVLPVMLQGNVSELTSPVDQWLATACSPGGRVKVRRHEVAPGLHGLVAAEGILKGDLILEVPSKLSIFSDKSEQVQQGLLGIPTGYSLAG